MKLLKPLKSTLSWLFLLLALCLGVAGQQATQAPQPPPPQPPAQTAPQQTPEGSKAAPAPQNAPEKTITPEEARQLLGSVDAILKFDSRDTDLAIKHDVKRELTSRDKVQAFLEDRMKNDKDTKRMQQSELVLKKFGLLPRDFDLQSFLVELLREQVAGYYDPKTKTVYLLNWVDPAGQQPVLAHELTHALQDQNFGLEKWLKDPDTKNLQQEVAADEQTTVRHAVVEGQAMVTLLDYMLSPTDQNVVNAPLIVEALRHSMNVGTDSPVFAKAPLFLKEALTFPYNYGLNFERELLVKRGKKEAFAGVFRNPPQTTRQVMEPSTYLSGENLPPLMVPDFDKLLGHPYKRVDVGSIGELDVSLIAKQYGRSEAADSIAPHWRGGYYYAARPKDAKQDEEQSLGLIFVTKWSDPAAARQFAEIYSSWVPKRYKSARLSEGADTTTSANPGQMRGATTDGAAKWETDEGTVTIEVQGDTLLAIESLPDDAALKVRSAVFGKPATGN